MKFNSSASHLIFSFNGLDISLGTDSKSIVFFCDQNSIDVESVPKLISKPLKDKIKRDAQELNFMKKSSRAKLPI